MGIRLRLDEARKPGRGWTGAAAPPNRTFAPMNAAYAGLRDRRRAVEDRDPAADGAFVYAVRSTGVYCRPSCPSRRPLWKNVELYDAPRAAETAGYRACKRCQPQQALPKGAAAIVEACRRLEAEAPIQSAALAEAAGFSLYHFQRLFKAHTGTTPQAYRRRILAERAKAQLGDAASVTEAVYQAGFSASSRFYETLGPELGMPARRAQRRGSGESLAYAVRRTSLGCCLIAWTERGVCDVRLGDREGPLVEALGQRFSAATRARRDLPAFVAAILEAVERPRAVHVPLDIQGTAFQQRVWAALRAIPIGETRSYQALAAELGAPGSARAVARACASNVLAVVIPCHRVVRSDGGLSGYRWGPERKRRLLEREREKKG